MLYPSSVTTRKLKYLACEHGLIPFGSHRACFDVITMLTIMGQYSLPEIIARAAEDTITLQALVSFQEKDRARDRGYHWKPDTKQWLILLKESDALVERETCGFKTEIIPAVAVSAPRELGAIPEPARPAAAICAECDLVGGTCFDCQQTDHWRTAPIVPRPPSLPRPPAEKPDHRLAWELRGTVSA